MNMFSPLLAISAVAALITFLAAAVQDWKTRSVARLTWLPASVIGGICILLFWLDIFQEGLTFQYGLVLGLSILLAFLFAGFAGIGLFGKADAKALILLSLTVPVTPFGDWIFPSLAISTILNAGVLMLAIPVCLLLYNMIKKNRAPFWILCSGYPVSDVTNHFGFLAEEISETDGIISRKFIRLYDAFFSLRRGRRTQEADIELCKKCGAVWITIGIPLLVPLTGGLILAMFGVSVLDVFLTVL